METCGGTQVNAKEMVGIRYVRRPRQLWGKDPLVTAGEARHNECRTTRPSDRHGNRRQLKGDEDRHGCWGGKVPIGTHFGSVRKESKNQNSCVAGSAFPMRKR